MTSPRIDRLRGEIKAGTFETHERIAGTVARLEPEIHGKQKPLILGRIACEVLRPFIMQGLDDQRAINVILSEPDDG